MRKAGSERMKRENVMLWMVSSILAVIFLVPFSGLAKEESTYLTKIELYSELDKKLVRQLEPVLLELEEKVPLEFYPHRFQLFSSEEAPLGGIGIWKNPFDEKNRYLGISAKVVVSTRYFPNTVWGRMASVMDEYVKPLFILLEKALEQIPDERIKGAVVVLVYNGYPLSHPEYKKQAEAIVIYISRDNLREFNSFKLSFPKLLEKTDWCQFQGEKQIDVLLNTFLRP